MEIGSNPQAITDFPSRNYLFIEYMPSNNFFKQVIERFFPPEGQPGGDTLQKTTSVMQPTVVVNQDWVSKKEPYGTLDPKMVKGRSSGWSQVQNLSQNLDIAKVQSAFRAAERGDCTLLFAYYRDLLISTSMVTTELSKRKLSVLAEPHTILPVDKKNADDVHAAEVIEDMIQNCPKWLPGMVHLMNAVIYPVSISEKIFRPVEPWELNPHGLRYYLKEIYPVNYVLVNYRLPYLPQGPINPGGAYPVPQQNSGGQPWFYQNLASSTGDPENTIYNLDSWESDIRLWHCFNNGLIDYSWSNIYRLDPARHIAYRCNLLNGIARDNFGGLGRAILFWAIMAQLGREYFLRLMDRYGLPFVTVHADTSQTDTMTMLENALGMATKLNALVVNKDAIVEIKEIAMSGAADGHEKFLNFCQDQISLLICGQTLSSHAKGTGMGSGVAKLQGEVRQDIINYDKQCLATVLRTQLFKQFLEINGIKGRPPIITWGSESTDPKLLSSALQSLKSAGLEPTDAAVETLSEKFGFELQRVENAQQFGPDGKAINPFGNNSQDNKDEEDTETEDNPKEEKVEEENG
jgi:hypothetical protein